MLNEVVSLEECEVYSWFPEPEYDPHIDAEDGETSQDGFPYEEEAVQAEDASMDVEDSETPASWGQGGMEMDDVPGSVPMARTRTTSGKGKGDVRDTPVSDRLEEWEAGRVRRGGGLLWSANYFFYSK